MNKMRRNALDDIRNGLETPMIAVEDLRDEEQEAFDNMPEGLQLSERGETMEEAIDNLDTAISDISEAMDCILEAIG